MNNFSDKMPKRWVVGVAMLVIYAPYGWLVFINYPWNSYRWQWIKMWPVLPGVVATYLTVPFLPRAWRPPWTEAFFYGLASILTVLLLTAVILGLIRVRRAFWLVVAGVSVLSCLFGLAAYAMFRA